MRLRELFEETPTLTSPIDTSTGRTPVSATGGEVGSGLFAKVHDQTPFSVLKTPKGFYRGTNLADDAYFQYLLTVVRENKFESNPYLPRIHDVIVYKESEDGDALNYQVEIEKLESFYDLDDREIVAIANKMFVNPETGLNSWGSESKGLIKLVEFSMKRQHFPKIKDPLYADAVELVNLVLLRGTLAGFYIDIHRNNVMIRRGPYMPQLVITDPLADRR